MLLVNAVHKYRYLGPITQRRTLFGIMIEFVDDGLEFCSDCPWTSMSRRGRRILPMVQSSFISPLPVVELPVYVAQVLFKNQGRKL
jgi:hypothetical protein